MRADLFNRVAWRIQLPGLRYVVSMPGCRYLPGNLPVVRIRWPKIWCRPSSRMAASITEHGLSPFKPIFARAPATPLKAFMKILAKSAQFNGIIFHDECHLVRL
ncbi:poly-beta-1,6-N-acetyl-D-glucosamine N-deacetylase PgaB [Acinetobacter indicus]